MPTKERKTLTDAQIDVLESLAAHRVPEDQIATYLGFSKSTLDRIKKRSAKVREALDRGKVMGSVKYRQRLFELVTREEVEKERVTVIVDQNGKEIERTTKRVKKRVDPHPRLMEFWGRTQEGFKNTDTLEIIGASGQALFSPTMSNEDIEKRLQQLRKLDDEKNK